MAFVHSAEEIEVELRQALKEAHEYAADCPGAAEYAIQQAEEGAASLRKINFATVFDELRRIRRMDTLTWVEQEQVSRWLEDGFVLKNGSYELRELNQLRLNHLAAVAWLPKSVWRALAA